MAWSRLELAPSLGRFMWGDELPTERALEAHVSFEVHREGTI